MRFSKLNEQKIRDLAMGWNCHNALRCTNQPYVFLAATEHLIYVLSTEIATIGAPGPIACSWQAIVDDIAATTASRPTTAVAPSASNTLPATAATFQAPAVMQPSIMAAHMQALQSGANAVASAAQPSATATGPTGVQARSTANAISAGDVKVGKEIIPVRIEFFKNSLPHIFKNKTGHVLDTPEHRELFIKIASDLKNFRVVDKRGNHWYEKILPNGKQVWVIVRDNFIRDAGINEVPKIIDDSTGLSRNLNL